MSKSKLVARRSKCLDLNLYSKDGDKSLDETLLQPYKHIAKHLNRGVTRAIVNAFNYWFQQPPEKVDKVEEIVRIFYNGSFLFDDIEDKSILRRGKPVAHSIYGAPNTIAASNYSFIIAFNKVLDMVDAEMTENRDEITRKLTEIIVAGFRAQGMEIYWRENSICPTEEEFFRMCKMKANGLFKLAVILLSGSSTENEDLLKLTEIMGLGFQLVNDYQNLASETCHERKTFCEDITEGKFSFPIIHAINSRPEDHRIMEILLLRTTDYKLKRHCLDLIKECGSLEYAKHKIAEIRGEIMQETKRFGDNPQLKLMVEFVLGKSE